MKDVSNDLHIGERIREVLSTKNCNACWLASQIPCERSNVYNIFKRHNIGIDLLLRISQVLEHDFFAELSAYYQQQSVVEPATEA